MSLGAKAKLLHAVFVLLVFGIPVAGCVIAEPRLVAGWAPVWVVWLAFAGLFVSPPTNYPKTFYAGVSIALSASLVCLVYQLSSDPDTWWEPWASMGPNPGMDFHRLRTLISAPGASVAGMSSGRGRGVLTYLRAGPAAVAFEILYLTWRSTLSHAAYSDEHFADFGHFLFAFVWGSTGGALLRLLLVRLMGESCVGARGSELRT